MKKICEIIAFVSFFFLLGVVGGIEHDTMTLSVGVVYLAIGLALFGLSSWLCEKLS
jgi:hypothetical protein